MSAVGKKSGAASGAKRKPATAAAKPKAASAAVEERAKGSVLDAQEKAPPSEKVAGGGDHLGVPHQPRGLDDATITRIWVGGIALAVILAVGLGVLYGPATGVLVLATAAFCAVIALFWASLRTLLGETPIQTADAFALGAVHGEDEQKRAILRALKDLEFERSVGKISEIDYRDLVVRLRSQAKDLLRQMDERSVDQRRRAEEFVAESIGPHGPVEPAQEEGDAKSKDAPAPAAKSKAEKADDDDDASEDEERGDDNDASKADESDGADADEEEEDGSSDEGDREADEPAEKAAAAQKGDA